MVLPSERRVVRGFGSGVPIEVKNRGWGIMDRVRVRVRGRVRVNVPGSFDAGQH